MSKPLVLLGLLCVAAPAYALHLPGLFSDNMVLQTGPRTPIYGTAEPREILTIEVGTHKAMAMADSNGNWRVEMSLPVAEGPLELTVKGSFETITCTNVLVGEVWVCSGQSNMEWSLHDANVVGQKVASIDPLQPQLRLFTVQHNLEPNPTGEVSGRWELCDARSVNSFSLLGFYFGTHLQQRLGGPVGLIQSTWGGTPAESWTPKETLQADPQLEPLLESNDRNVPTGAGMQGPKGKPKPERAPCVLYNGMIAPLLQFGFKGVIWYQGESNVGRGLQYRALFPAMIKSWRDNAARQFPFLFVQLANFGSPAGSAEWAEVREAQLFTLKSVPKTGMASAVDLGKSNDIHSPKKDELGKRLAWVAMNKAYGQVKSPATGPVLTNWRIEGSGIRLEFVGKINGIVMRSYNGLSGFEIAGADRKFYKAQARIDRGTIVVSASEVKAPVAVRYGWADDCEASFFNSAGLPASPFRTDNWPINETESKAELLDRLLDLDDEAVE